MPSMKGELKPNFLSPPVTSERKLHRGKAGIRFVTTDLTAEHLTTLTPTTPPRLAKSSSVRLL